MELRIFNSILFNELRPWQPENLVDSNFIEKLREVDDSIPDSAKDLYTRLNILLSNHPRLLDFTESYLAQNQPLSPSIFLNESRLTSNAPAEFYQKLIKLESIRALNNYCTAIGETTVVIDKQYRAKIAWTNIRYIIVNAHDILNNQFNYVLVGGGTNENSNARRLLFNSVSVLSMLKLHCLKLFFEIQTIYKEYLTTIETPEHFFRYVLKQDTHYDPELEYSSYYYERQVDLFGSMPGSSIQSVLPLYNEIQELIREGRNSLINAFSAIENLMFIEHAKMRSVDLSFANLANPAISAKLFEGEKQNISSKINQLGYGNQRYDHIQECLDSLNSLPIDQTMQIPDRLLSAPRRIIKWLKNQSETYRVNLSAVFSIEPDPRDELRKRVKPLPKTSVATLNDNKKVAKEILNYLSGRNIQQEKIMSDQDFNKMINYTFHLIETDDIPPEIKRIPQIGVSNELLRYTYYLIHKSLYGTRRIHSTWITFLHSVFGQFSNTKTETTRTKFSKKPPMYQADMNKMSR